MEPIKGMSPKQAKAALKPTPSMLRAGSVKASMDTPKQKKK